MDLYSETYPESWYAVLPSQKLRRGEARPLDALGRALVLFRTESGGVAAVDRACPHMGASLACGKVSGERIVCPFHAWEFGRDGECRRIPYEAKIPKRARVSSLPVVEHLGWIWAYHGESPAYRLPDVPEWNRRGFTVHQWSRTLDVHPLMILENSGDLQHFKYVHQLDFEKIDVEILRDEAHDFAFAIALEGPTGRKLFEGRRQRLTFHYAGASAIFGTVELDGRMVSRFLVAPLPISARRTLVHQVVIAKWLRGVLWPLNALFVPMLVYHTYRGIADEYGPVWRDMSTTSPRVLVRDDWLQQRFHRYYRAHFPEPERSAGIGRAELTSPEPERVHAT